MVDRGLEFGNQHGVVTCQLQETHRTNGIAKADSVGMDQPAFCDRHQAGAVVTDLQLVHVQDGTCSRNANVTLGLGAVAKHQFGVTFHPAPEFQNARGNVKRCLVACVFANNRSA